MYISSMKNNNIFLEYDEGIEFLRPKSWDEIHQWVDQFPEESRPTLITAIMMAWNLAHAKMEMHCSNEVLG